MVPHLSHLKSLECEPCHLGKHVQASFPSIGLRQENSPFDLVYLDIWGPSQVSSISGYRCFVTLTVDLSKCT